VDFDRKVKSTNAIIIVIAIILSTILQETLSELDIVFRMLI
jgi:hypothetical protein